MNSSGFEDFRLVSEGEALSMQGGHQCAPTYSPKTECPGLVANRGIGSCCRTSLKSASFSESRPPKKGSAERAKKAQATAKTLSLEVWCTINEKVDPV